MGKKGNLGDGSPPNAEELEEEPEPEHEQGRDADKFYEDEDKHQGENPGRWKEKQVGAQNPGNRPAGPDHGNGRVRIGEDLGEASSEAADQVKEEKAEMAQGIFDVVAEDPEIEHVSEEVQESAMEEHGRKNGEGDRHRRKLMEDLSMDDLIGNRTPFKDKVLTFNNIQGNLVKKDQTIGQDDSNGDQGKGRGGIIVFEGQKQGSGPFSRESILNVESFAEACQGNLANLARCGLPKGKPGASRSVL